MIKTTFVIATLMRDSVYRTLSGIRAMFPTLYDTGEIPIVLYYEPEVNEYVVRNKAVKQVTTPYVTFIDDDAYPSKNFYKVLEPYLGDKHVITGPVRTMNMLFGEKYHGIGTNFTISVDVFRDLGGFEESWGNPDFIRGGFGWRSDTDLLWRYLDRFGDDEYVHDDKLIVIHPNQFNSEFILPIEIEFIKRHLDRVKKHFFPIDPRAVIVYDLFIGKKVSDELLEWKRKKKDLVVTMAKTVMDQYKKYKNILPELKEDLLKEILA
ncbi:MAG: hypothetical protein QXJ81_05045 [Metallosphaera sp.]